MGAEPYWYFEKYEGNVAVALKALREREFAAGRYNPVIASMWRLFRMALSHCLLRAG